MPTLRRIFSNPTNSNIIYNVAGAFIFKGGAVLLNILSMPLYLRYFNNNEALGFWFTIINVLNWILTFDLGIGNGLRNNLTTTLSEGNSIKTKELISSAYILLGILVGGCCATFFAISGYVDWNGFFNINQEIFSDGILRESVNITMGGILVSFFFRLVIAINYALQKSALNNLIGFISALLTYLYLLVVSPNPTPDENLMSLSIFQAIAVNIPLIIATIIAFRHERLKQARPSFLFFRYESGKKVLSLGISFLYVQLLYMVIMVTNEWFITKFYNSVYCVDYQIYHKLFSIIGMVFMLTLTPLWSAITKAYADKRYKWIIKVYKFLCLLVVAVTILQILIVPLMPRIMQLWLGKQAIEINDATVMVFVIFSVIYIWNAVQSVIVSGLGMLNLQIYGYTFAAVFKIIAIVLFHDSFNWDWVVLATCLGLIPYCITQPIWIWHQIKDLRNR